MHHDLIFYKPIGMRYKLYFVNHDGLFLIMHDYSKVRLVRMINTLRKVQNNLILK